jgi:hypothetical protein
LGVVRRRSLRVKTIRNSFLVVVALSVVAMAAPFLTPEDVAGGDVLAGSTSPNGTLCFIEAFRGPYTSNAIVLASH